MKDAEDRHQNTQILIAKAETEKHGLIHLHFDATDKCYTLTENAQTSNHVLYSSRSEKSLRDFARRNFKVELTNAAFNNFSL